MTTNKGGFCEVCQRAQVPVGYDKCPACGWVPPPAPQLPRQKAVPHGTQEDHPAYAVIGASRVSSNPGALLYGSDFRHGHYVMIRIYDSSLMRSLSRDWVHSGSREYISVALSEAQWATFISTPNQGDGVACTLERLQGQMVPDIARRTDRREQFRGELRSATEEALAALKEARTFIENNWSGSKTGQKTLLEKIQVAWQRLTDSVPWVAKSFDEHAERTTERARIEVEAYLTSAIQRAGLKALQAAGAADQRPFQLDAGEEGTDETQNG